MSKPTSEQIEKLRQAGERLLDFAWNFDVDLRDAGLRARIDQAEGGPWAPGPGPSRRLSAPGFQAIREHYYDQFLPLIPVAHGFFAALSEAGAQELLASRAGMEALDPARRPSESVHFGPVPLPSAKSRSYDRFAEAQGGTHVAGARLIWWCAASHLPWKFGYSVDLSWYVWTRIPWIHVSGGGVAMADGALDCMRDCVSYLCDLIEAPEVEDQRSIQHKIEVGEETSPDQAEYPSAPSTPSPMPTMPPGERWAVGLGGGGRWHLFRRFGKSWKYAREVKFPSRRTSGNLLVALLEGHASLTFLRAFEALAKQRLDPSDVEYLSSLDHAKIRGQVKSAISYLRKALHEAVGTDQFETIVYDETSKEYRLLLPIGYAVEGLSDTNEPTDKLVFEAIS